MNSSFSTYQTLSFTTDHIHLFVCDSLQCVGFVISQEELALEPEIRLDHSRAFV